MNKTICKKCLPISSTTSDCFVFRQTEETNVCVTIKKYNFCENCENENCNDKYDKCDKCNIECLLCTKGGIYDNATAIIGTYDSNFKNCFCCHGYITTCFRILDHCKSDLCGCLNEQYS